MQCFTGQTFESWQDRPSLLPWQRGRFFEDLEFLECVFDRCLISVTADPRRRSRARNLRFVNCSAKAVTIYSLEAERVVVDGLRTESLLQVVGAVFKHCILKGKIGSILICGPRGDIGSIQERQLLEQCNAKFYSDVDWALDISGGEFAEIDLRGVPGHLIKRDPSTQALVSRQRALEGKWRELDLSGTHWPIALEKLAESGRTSEVFVAGRGARNFKKLLDGLNRLRDAGVAELE